MGGRGGASHRVSGAYVFGREPAFQNVLDLLDVTAATAYHSINNFDWAKWQGMTDAQKNGVYDYTDYYYGRMNDYLRGKGTISISDQNRIKYATEALDKWATKDNFWAYRGTSISGTAGLLGGTVQQMSDPAFLRSLIGKTVIDQGFMSTAIHQSSAWSGVRYKVFIPKGTHGMYVDPISANRGELEFLLQRGTRFKVHRVETNSSGALSSLVLEVII